MEMSSINTKTPLKCGTYRRMCWFGAGECRVINHTMIRKWKNNYFRLDQELSTRR